MTSNMFVSLLPSGQCLVRSRSYINLCVDVDVCGGGEGEGGKGGGEKREEGEREGRIKREREGKEEGRERDASIRSMLSEIT